MRGIEEGEIVRGISGRARDGDKDIDEPIAFRSADLHRGQSVMAVEPISRIDQANLRDAPHHFTANTIPILLPLLFLFLFFPCRPCIPW